MNMISREFSEWCFNRGVRIEWMLPLGAAHDGEQCGDILRDFVEAEAADYDVSDVLDWFGENRMNGWLVNVGMCVRDYLSNGGYSSSWGHSTERAFYGTDLDTIGAEIVKWAEGRIEKWKAIGGPRA